MRKLLGLTLLLTCFGTTFLQVQASELYDRSVEDYDYQIDQYRKAYSDYLLKKEQFDAIDSFANQEELVVSARTMLILRGKVYEVYWQALTTLLSETPGIDAVIRERLLTTLAQNQAQLIDHQDFLLSKSTLAELLREAQWLNVLERTYVNTAYEIILNVKVARLHNALLELEAYVPILRENVEIQI